MTDRETTNCGVYFVRRRDGQAELVARFVYTDLAQLAARAITERHHYPTEVRYDDESFLPKRYEWGTVEREAVVETP